ncbi:MAG: GNAT family N-acetyltransferase [Bacteroidales bacterium]
MKIKKIDRFSERVYQAVLRLIPQLSSDADLSDKQYFKSILSSENSHFFIAELDNKRIAGMLTIGSYRIPTGIKVWIEDVVVDETQRGKGIGKELMLHAIKYSGSLGAKTVGLTSRPSRASANRLYQKMGFVRYETNVYKYNIQ